MAYDLGNASPPVCHKYHCHEHFENMSLLSITLFIGSAAAWIASPSSSSGTRDLLVVQGVLGKEGDVMEIGDLTSFKPSKGNLTKKFASDISLGSSNHAL